MILMRGHRNNHRAQLRSDLIAAAASVKLPSRVRTIALVWPIDSPTLPRDALHALCTTRIVQRGANHQTLRAGEGHEGAIWQFLGQYEPFDQAMNSGDMKFDEVVEMRAEWSREDALLVVVDHLVRILGLPRPSQESIERAIQKGKDYRPVVMKQAVEKKVAKVGVPRYFGVKVEQDLKSLLDPLFSSNEPDAFLFIKLQSLYRVEPNPHITLVHSAELVPTPSPTPLELELQATRQGLWDYFTTLTLDPLSPLLEVTLTLGPKIVWDDRAMAIEVSSLSSPSSSLPAALGKFHAHITVGTIENSVRPIEGKWLFEAVASGEEESKEGGRIRVRTMECRECKGVIAGLR
jgi:tRNA ligase